MSQLDPAEQWLRENDPEYLKSKQTFKHARGRSYGSPYEEVPIGGASDEAYVEDAESGERSTAAGNDAVFSDLYDPDRAILGDQVKRDVDQVRDRQPHRKKDRHKGSRAAYMREYRAQKKAEGA